VAVLRVAVVQATAAWLKRHHVTELACASAWLYALPPHHQQHQQHCSNSGISSLSRRQGKGLAYRRVSCEVPQTFRERNLLTS